MSAVVVAAEWKASDEVEEEQEEQEGDTKRLQRHESSASLDKGLARLGLGPARSILCRAWDTTDVSVYVPRDGTASWKWRVLEHNIDFAAFAARKEGGDEECVSRVPSKHVAAGRWVAGFYRAHKDARLRLAFDNRFSWLRPKKVEYTVDITRPPPPKPRAPWTQVSETTGQLTRVYDHVDAPPDIVLVPERRARSHGRWFRPRSGNGNGRVPAVFCVFIFAVTLVICAAVAFSGWKLWDIDERGTGRHRVNETCNWTMTVGDQTFPMSCGTNSSHRHVLNSSSAQENHAALYHCPPCPDGQPCDFSVGQKQPRQCLSVTCAVNNTCVPGADESFARCQKWEERHLIIHLGVYALAIAAGLILTVVNVCTCERNFKLDWVYLAFYAFPGLVFTIMTAIFLVICQQEYKTTNQDRLYALAVIAPIVTTVMITCGVCDHMHHNTANDITIGEADYSGNGKLGMWSMILVWIVLLSDDTLQTSLLWSEARNQSVWHQQQLLLPSVAPCPIAESIYYSIASLVFSLLCMALTARFRELQVQTLRTKDDIVAMSIAVPTLIAWITTLAFRAACVGAKQSVLQAYIYTIIALYSAVIILHLVFGFLVKANLMRPDGVVYFNERGGLCGLCSTDSWFAKARTYVSRLNPFFRGIVVHALICMALLYAGTGIPPQLPSS